MKKLIQIALSEVVTLGEASDRIISLFQVIKTQRESGGKIGYVAGIINSDGPQSVKINRRRLTQYAKLLKKLHLFPIFSAADIFTHRVNRTIQEMRLPIVERESRVYIFWRKLLSSGHITDIFMTPRWEISKGAVDEHKTAKRVGLKIHYVEKSFFPQG